MAEKEVRDPKSDDFRDTGDTRDYDEHDYRRGLGDDYEAAHAPVSPADKSRERKEEDPSSRDEAK